MDLDIAAEVHAERHVAWLEPSLRVVKDDDGTPAGADDSFGRHHKALTPRAGDSQAQQHARREPSGLVVDLEPRLQRASCAADLGKDLFQFAFESLRGIGLK